MKFTFRLLKNRKSARKSRRKRKVIYKNLNEEVEVLRDRYKELQEENRILKEQLRESNQRCNECSRNN